MLIKKKLHFEVIKVIFNNLRSFNIPRWHIWEETGTTFIDQSGAKLVKQAAQNGGFFRVQIRITFALATTASQIPEIPYLPSRTPSPFRLRPDEPRSPGGAVMNAGLIVRGRRGWQRGHGRAVIRFGRRVGWRNRRRRFDDMCRRMLMMKEVFFFNFEGVDGEWLWRFNFAGFALWVCVGMSPMLRVLLIWALMRDSMGVVKRTF